MRLVYNEMEDFNIRKQLFPGDPSERLRSGKKHIDFPGAGSGAHPIALFVALSPPQRLRHQACVPATPELFVEKGQQGYNHEGDSSADSGGKLVAQGLTGSGWQHNDLVLFLYRVGDDKTLDRIQIGNVEVPLSRFDNRIGKPTPF